MTCVIKDLISIMRSVGLPRRSVNLPPGKRRLPFLFWVYLMYILYLDESGSPHNKQEEHFVLAGIAVRAEQVNWFTSQLDSIAQGIDPQNPLQVEFHAYEIFARKREPWKSLKTKDRAIGVISSVLKVVEESYSSTTLFGCVIHKASFSEEDVIQMALEDIYSRFDKFLDRRQKEGDKHRGIVVLDKKSGSRYEMVLQKLGKNFRDSGTRWTSRIQNIVEVPMFIDSRFSRMIQLADHVAYALFRRYNAHDTRYFDIIISRFDQADGIIHGLAHKHKLSRQCMCPACFSRRRESHNV